MLRRTYPGNHVLTLGGDEELAVEALFPVGRVAREGHARGAALAHVAEHHGLDVDGRAPVGGNIVELAIDNRALVLPGCKDRGYCTPELLLGVGGEGAPRPLLYDTFETGDQPFEVGSGELGVELHLALLLQLFYRGLEGVGLCGCLGTETHHDIGVHLYEAAITVPGKPLVAGRLGQALYRLVVEAEVEDGVHHAGHRGRCARTHRHQQRVTSVPEAALHFGLERRKRLFDLLGKPGRIAVTGGIVELADLGGNGEPGRNGQP